MHRLFRIQSQIKNGHSRIFVLDKSVLPTIINHSNIPGRLLNLLIRICKTLFLFV